MPLPRFSGASRFLGAGFRSTPRTGPANTPPANKGLPVIHGGTRGLKKFVATTTGKSYARQEDIKNLNLYTAAVKSGARSFVDGHGKIHDIGTASKRQEYMVRHMGQSGGDIKTREGVQQYTRGYVETARTLGIRLKQGENIGSVGEATGKILKDITPKPVEMDKHRQALDQLHAAIRPPPPASAPGIRPSTSTTMPLQAVEPVSPPSSRQLGTTFAAPTGGVGITGAQDQPNEPTVSFGVPVTTHRDAAAAIPITAPVNEGAVVSPAVTFQEPEPLNQSLPPPPIVPTEKTSTTSTPTVE